MKQFELPQGWTGIIAEKRWSKPFGLCRWDSRMITVWPVSWIPSWFGLRDFTTGLTWNHEVLHAWGNPGCKNTWCLGYEASFEEENKAMINQMLHGFKFCEQCLSYYKKEE